MDLHSQSLDEPEFIGLWVTETWFKQAEARGCGRGFGRISRPKVLMVTASSGLDLLPNTAGSRRSTGVTKTLSLSFSALSSSRESLVGWLLQDKLWQPPAFPGLYPTTLAIRTGRVYPFPLIPAKVSELTPNWPIGLNWSPRTRERNIPIVQAYVLPLKLGREVSPAWTTQEWVSSRYERGVSQKKNQDAFTKRRGIVLGRKHQQVSLQKYSRVLSFFRRGDGSY